MSVGFTRCGSCAKSETSSPSATSNVFIDAAGETCAAAGAPVRASIAGSNKAAGPRRQGSGMRVFLTTDGLLKDRKTTDALYRKHMAMLSHARPAAALTRMSRIALALENVETMYGT